MRFLRGVLALTLALGLVLTVGSVVPDEALAVEVVVGGTLYDCDMDGLTGAVGAAQSGDTITFDCGPINEIAFTDGDAITIDKALTIDGESESEFEPDMTLLGQDETNFFVVTATGDLTLGNLSLEDGEAEKGGAIYVADGGVLTTSGDVTFRENRATDGDDNGDTEVGWGGAIYVEEGGTVVIRETYFEGNAADEDGGAIYLAGGESEQISSLSIVFSSFNENRAITDEGGAIYSEPGNVVAIASSEFEYNEADENGGAILIDHGTLAVKDSEFRGNFAYDSGGAILVSHTTLEIFRNNFVGNTVWNDDGGALAIFFDSEATISQSVFADNGSDSDGGAIIVENSTSLNISRSTFDNNSAYGDGGAILNEQTSMHINASTFLNNDTGTYGSDIYINGSTPSPLSSISWSTIVQSEDATNAPSLFIGRDITMTGVILDGPGDSCLLETEGDLSQNSVIDDYTLSNDESCELSGANSQENIDVGLAESETIDIHDLFFTYFPLEAGSPAHNAGPAVCNTDVQPGDDTDQLGNVRPQGGNCDIGAIEVNNVPPMIDGFERSAEYVYEGIPVEITIYAGDNPEETLDGPIQYAIDCDVNDEISPEFSYSDTLECIYPDNGFFLGSLIVTDGLASSSRLFGMNIDNVAPVMTDIDAGSVAVLNGPFSFQMHATDVAADMLIFTYDCGNGTVASTVEVGSDTGEFSAEGTCTYTDLSSHTISVFATDDDGGVSDPPMTISVLVGVPNTLCADRWNGQLRYVDGGDCDRGETLIQLPQDAPLSICVNNWNGSARVASDCSRSEHVVIVQGNGSVGVCVNRWNGSMRVSDRCSRSEVEREL